MKILLPFIFSLFFIFFSGNVNFTPEPQNTASDTLIFSKERHFKNMVMQSPIAMTIFRGPDFVIETANIKMYKNIWRKEEAEVVGKKLLDVFPELKGQKYPALLTEVFTHAKIIRENESVAYVQGNDGMRQFYFDCNQ